MGKKGTRLTWLWVLLAVVLAGVIGYFIYAKNDKGPEEALIPEKLASIDEKRPLEEPPNTTGQSDEAATDLKNETPTARPSLEQHYKIQTNATKIPSTQIQKNDHTAQIEKNDHAAQTQKNEKGDDCAQIEKNVMAFFSYLDEKKYIRGQGLDSDTYTRFKKMLGQLVSHPPIPAGEAANPKTIIQNMFHFYRVLSRDDLRMIGEILSKENDTLEFNLEMFYRWLMLGDRCPNPDGLRPSMEVLYQYAGFLVNTTGGRACLFRRPPDIRLLISYYCLLIVHQADKRGRNHYGIDILPFIIPLKNEIGHYSDFHFQENYIDELNRIQRYYWQKR